jgi:hypothetical protein
LWKFGKPWAPPKCKTYAWLIIKTEFGRQIGLGVADGKITVDASFATKSKNQLLIFYSSVASQSEFGHPLEIGLN